PLARVFLCLEGEDHLCPVAASTGSARSGTTACGEDESELSDGTAASSTITNGSSTETQPLKIKIWPKQVILPNLRGQIILQTAIAPSVGSLLPHLLRPLVS